MLRYIQIFIILLVAGVVMAERSPNYEYVVKPFHVKTTNATSAFASQDTTGVYSAMSIDQMKVYRNSSIYLMYIDNSTKSETVYVCLDYKPTGADSLGWFTWDSFGFVTSNAVEVCTAFVHDTLTIWPSDSIRLRLHRIQIADSLMEYKLVSRFYNLQ